MYFKIYKLCGYVLTGNILNHTQQLLYREYTLTYAVYSEVLRHTPNKRLQQHPCIAYVGFKRG